MVVMGGIGTVRGGAKGVIGIMIMGGIGAAGNGAGLGCGGFDRLQNGHVAAHGAHVDLAVSVAADVALVFPYGGKIGGKVAAHGVQTDGKACVLGESKGQIAGHGVHLHPVGNVFQHAGKAGGGGIKVQLAQASGKCDVSGGSVHVQTADRAVFKFGGAAGGVDLHLPDDHVADGQIGGGGIEFQRITDPASGNGDGQVLAAVAKVKAEADDIAVLAVLDNQLVAGLLPDHLIFVGAIAGFEKGNFLHVPRLDGDGTGDPFDFDFPDGSGVCGTDRTGLVDTVQLETLSINPAVNRGGDVNPAAPAYLLGTVNDHIVAHIQCADRSRLGVGHGVDTGLRYHGDRAFCDGSIGLTRWRLGGCDIGAVVHRIGAAVEHREEVVAQPGNENCQQHKNHDAPDDDANDCVGLHLIYPPSGQEWLSQAPARRR